MALIFSDVTCCGLCRNLSDVLWEAISTRQVLSLYQGLGTKNLQSFISQFVYFYGYSYFKKLYIERSGVKSIGTKANLVIAAAAGACTAIVTQVNYLCVMLSSSVSELFKLCYLTFGVGCKIIDFMIYETFLVLHLQSELNSFAAYEFFSIMI